jgi:hypothetical protein
MGRVPFSILAAAEILFSAHLANRLIGQYFLRARWSQKNASTWRLTIADNPVVISSAG